MINSDRARSFDAVADSYDAGRPGYPETLVDDAIALASLPPGGRILEIGCGSGQATRAFAGRGFRMTCLEPGPNLAALARRNLAAFPSVEVIVQRFEDWPVEPGAFDLVLAATSLHHVAPELRYARSARALRAGGALAVLSNRPGDEDPVLRAELDAVYARWRGPESVRDYAGWSLDRWIAWLRDDIDRSGFFAPAAIRQAAWNQEYDQSQFLALLNSYSDRLNHPADSEAELRRDLAALVARRGGTIRRAYVSILAVARRA